MFESKDGPKRVFMSLLLKRGESNMFLVRRSEAKRAEFGCVNKKCEMVVRLGLKKGVWV